MPESLRALGLAPRTASEARKVGEGSGVSWYAADMRRLLLPLWALALLACGEGIFDESQELTGADRGAADAGASDLRSPGDGGSGSLAGTYLLTLDAGAFPPTPAHPSALVYVPPGFDPTPPLSVVVFIHGFNNCVENVVRDSGQSCNPKAGTPARTAFALSSLMRDSGRNALLLCPEVAFDQASANPGQLGLPGGFRALLAETFKKLPGVLSLRTPADVGPLVVASHSGGYQVAAGIAVRGGVPVSELYLLDSLYGNELDFDGWVMSDLGSFAGTAPRRRFFDVYTASGGTLSDSRAMADRARGWVVADPSVLIDDRTTSTWPDTTFHHGLLFKLSMLTHDGVVHYYLGKLLSTGSLPMRRLTF